MTSIWISKARFTAITVRKIGLKADGRGLLMHSVMSELRGARIGGCCKDCADRYPACHDSCETYQDALREWKEYKNKVKDALSPSEADKYKFQSVKAMRKRRKWHDR